MGACCEPQSLTGGPPLSGPAHQIAEQLLRLSRLTPDETSPRVLAAHAARIAAARARHGEEAWREARRFLHAVLRVECRRWEARAAFLRRCAARCRHAGRAPSAADVHGAGEAEDARWCRRHRLRAALACTAAGCVDFAPRDPS
jgi:hypothetical protein